MPQHKGSLLVLYGAAILAALGGFIIGFDTGAISGIVAMPQFAASFPNIPAYQLGLLVSTILFTSLVGCLASGWIADRYSRKRSIIIGSLLFGVGAAMETAGINLKFLFAARAVAGLGGGIMSNVIPMYHSEIAPAFIRGRLITLFQLAGTIGIALGYFVCLGTQSISGDAAWRIPFFIQIFTSIGLAAGCLSLPYSPRWLIFVNRNAEGLAVLADMRAGGDQSDPDVCREYDNIRAEVEMDRKMAETSWAELFRGTVLKRTLIGLFIQTFQQFTGINGVLYFAPTIFSQAGLNSYTSSLVATGITGIVNVIFTIPALIWIDYVGRKPALISGAAIQAVAMFVIGSVFAGASSTDSAGDVTIASKSAEWTIVAFIFVFIAGFAYSWGAVGTVYPAEIFPMRLRSKGMSLTTGSNWLFNIVVSFITPVFIADTSSGLYFFFGSCCVIMTVVCCFIPETKGRTLEDMEEVFGGTVTKEDALELGGYELEKNTERNLMEQMSLEAYEDDVKE